MFSLVNSVIFQLNLVWLLKSKRGTQFHLKAINEINVVLQRDYFWYGRKMFIMVMFRVLVQWVSFHIIKIVLHRKVMKMVRRMEKSPSGETGKRNLRQKVAGATFWKHLVQEQGADIFIKHWECERDLFMTTTPSACKYMVHKWYRKFK